MMLKPAGMADRKYTDASRMKAKKTLLSGHQNQWEGIKMNEYETEELSQEFSEEEISKNRENRDSPLEYCDVCFIALGSEEKRIYKGRYKFHPDCQAKANF